MKCPSCDRAIEPGQRFCTGCGRSLAGITDQTEPIPTTPDEAAAEAVPPPPVPPAPVPPAPAPPAPAPPAPAPPAPGSTDTAPGGDDPDWAEPEWAPTGSVPTQALTVTDDLPATEPITSVVPTPQPSYLDEIANEPDDTPAMGAAPPPPPYDGAADATAVLSSSPVAHTGSATTQMAVGYGDLYDPTAPPAARRGIRLTAVTLIGIAAGILTLISMFSNVLTISSTSRLTIGDNAPPGFRTGTWIVDDLADNLSIAGLIAALLMVVGGVASAFGWRWGGGLAGGAGLGFAGIAAIALGLAQFPIDAAHDFARIPTEQPFTLSITRDFGYWMLVATAAAGVVLFFASLNDGFADRRPGLNPWIAALGALSVVVTVAGPLIPENLALFSDNWYLVDAPGEPTAMLLVGRLVQLGLLALTGVVGFLSVRRWGLGVAAGGALPILWLGASTLFDLTDRPVGPGFRNPGATDMHLHGVTIIGVSALVSMLVLGAIAAYDQHVRERP